MFMNEEVEVIFEETTGRFFKKYFNCVKKLLARGWIRCIIR